jgi:hypothetical protein
MKYFVNLIFLFVCNFCTAQLSVKINFVNATKKPTSDTIYYNANQKLIWKDFKGTPPPNHVALAITASGFGYTAAMQSVDDKGTLTLKFYCYFHKKDSWVKKGLESDYALNHEQHHFDVTYICYNQFVEKIKAANFTMQNYAKQIETLYNEAIRNMQTMQNDYDGQTKNGQLKNIQAEWNTKIDAALSTKR